MQITDLQLIKKTKQKHKKACGYNAPIFKNQINLRILISLSKKNPFNPLIRGKNNKPQIPNSINKQLTTQQQTTQQLTINNKL